MASHYKWYPSTDDVTVPWNAQYEYPSYGNKAIKITPRISPKGGSTFTPNNTIRLEFPAQGYVNPANTTLAFDVTLVHYGDTVASSITNGLWFQNNIQSCFKQIRLLYGSAPLETLNEAGYMVRQFTEFTSSNGNLPDGSSINDGIGGTHLGYLGAPFDPNPTAGGSVAKTEQQYMLNTRLLSHGFSSSINVALVPGKSIPNRTVVSGQDTATKRYQVTFPLGLFTQGKLIPTKWMASQLAIEILLAPINECVLGIPICTSGAPLPGIPAYTISNVVMIPEILEFDASYDKMFLDGLNGGGVPIQLSTFNTNTSPVNGSIIQMVIPEKSRSLKNIFAYVRQSVASLQNDYGASFSDINTSVLEYYQVRVGGRYYPASPVLNTTVPGIRTGGTEPFIELQKALAILGDKRLSPSSSMLNWGKPAKVFDPTTVSLPAVSVPTLYGADDGQLISFSRDAAGFHTDIRYQASPVIRNQVGSACFCMAISLETSNGREISGLNAEEQSDIVFNCKWSSAPPSGYELIVYTHIDKIMLLKENNVVNLIE